MMDGSGGEGGGRVGGIVAPLYLGLATAWRRALGLADVGFVAFWLGLLPRRALHAVDDRMYRGRSRYHGEEHNLSGLFPWEEEAIRHHFRGRRRLVVIGGGGGREVLALARMGHEALGYECNEALVEVARRLIERSGSTAQTHWLPRDRAPREVGPVDGVIVGWCAYTLVVGRDARVRLLRELRALLGEGAPILISFFSRRGDDPRYGRIATGANWLRRPLGGRPVEPGDDLAPNFVHRFTRAEIEEELAAGGFRLASFAGQGAGPTDAGHAVGLALAPGPEGDAPRAP